MDPSSFGCSKQFNSSTWQVTLGSGTEIVNLRSEFMYANNITTDINIWYSSIANFVEDKRNVNLICFNKILTIFIYENLTTKSTNSPVDCCDEMFLFCSLNTKNVLAWIAFCLLWNDYCFLCVPLLLLRFILFIYYSFNIMINSGIFAYAFRHFIEIVPVRIVCRWVWNSVFSI